MFSLLVQNGFEKPKCIGTFMSYEDARSAIEPVEIWQQNNSHTRTLISQGYRFIKTCEVYENFEILPLDDNK
jgi:diketogulonate reductase-like aldo/keto reductase